MVCEGTERRSDECEVGGVDGHRGREVSVHSGCSHPHFESCWARGNSVEVVDRAGLPWDQVQSDPMFFIQRRRSGFYDLVPGPSSAVCMRTELVANTPRGWRAVIVRAANDRPWWWRVTG
jgi:hypothetical protein